MKQALFTLKSFCAVPKFYVDPKTKNSDLVKFFNDYGNFIRQIDSEIKFSKEKYFPPNKNEFLNDSSPLVKNLISSFYVYDNPNNVRRHHQIIFKKRGDSFYNLPCVIIDFDFDSVCWGCLGDKIKKFSSDLDYIGF